MSQLSIGFIAGISALNLFLVLFLSPLFEGVARKLIAGLQSRIGPPVTQPYYDLAKLLSKEDLRSSDNPLVRFAPFVCLMSVVVATLLVPMGDFNASTGTLQPPFGNYGDSILFIYLIAMGAMAIILTAAASENPLAAVGASRETMMHLSAESILFIALIAAAIDCKSFRMGEMVSWYHANGPTPSMILAGIFLFLSLQAQVGKTPFDIADAEQEIVGGVLIEQSGPSYALFKWYMMARQFVFCAVLTQVFIPWPITGVLAWDIIIFLGKVFAVFLVIGLVSAIFPRIRIDQAIRYCLYLSVFSLSAVFAALVENIEARRMAGWLTAVVFVAFIAAEARNLRWAVFFLALHCLALFGVVIWFGYLSGDHSLYWSAVVVFASEVVLIPLLIWIYLREMPGAEVKPLVEFLPSALIMVIVLPFTYYFTHSHLGPVFVRFIPSEYEPVADMAVASLGAGLTTSILGIYTLVVRRDLVKIVFGLVFLDNGFHLTLAGLAPSIRIPAEVGIACILVAACWLLLKLSLSTFKTRGTKDSVSLSELRG